jgi:hypothetical protein
MLHYYAVTIDRSAKYTTAQAACICELTTRAYCKSTVESIVVYCNQQSAAYYVYIYMLVAQTALR